jgi:hypothetical protein
MPKPIPVDIALAQKLFDAFAADTYKIVARARMRRLLLALECNGNLQAAFSHPETTNERAVASILGRALSVLIARPSPRDDAFIGASLDSLMARDRWKLCMHDYETSLAVVCSIMYLTMDLDTSKTWFVPQLCDVISAAMADEAWPFPGHANITAEMLDTNVKGTVEILYFSSIDPAWMQVVNPDIDYLDSVETVLALRPPFVNQPAHIAFELPDLAEHTFTSGSPL